MLCQSVFSGSQNQNFKKALPHPKNYTMKLHKKHAMFANSIKLELRKQLRNLVSFSFPINS